MAQAVWTGELSFGLVNIPVKLYSATAPKRVRFHQYEAGTGRRIRYARVPTGPALSDTRAPYEPPFDGPGEEATGRSERPLEGEAPLEVLEGPATGAPDATPSDLHEEPSPEPFRASPVDSRQEFPMDPTEEAEVPWDEVVKGYEVEPGRIVTVSPEELGSVAPERSSALEVEQFVDLRDIDPVYFDKSYYVVPSRGGQAERPYWLLYRAMEASGKVAVGRFVMRTKEYLAAVRPAEHVLMLETLFYADEVRDPKAIWIPQIEDPPERELRMADQLIEALTGEWEPDRHRDEHRERLLDLLRSKAGEALESQEPEEPISVSPVVDLMEALQASVEEAKRARMEEGDDDRLSG